MTQLMKEDEETKQYQVKDDSKYDAIYVDNEFIPMVVHLNRFNNNLILFASKVSKEFEEFLNSETIVSEWSELEQRLETPTSNS